MASEKQPNCLIKEGDQVIIKSPKVLKSFQLRKDRLIRVERYNFRLSGAIGHPYGTTFEVQQKELVKVEPEQDGSESQDNDIEQRKDNRNLKDDSENQKLKLEDLEELKKQGFSGADIIEHLKDNSATFNQKTSFSQAKYINKKKKRWESRFTILKPSTRLVAQKYYMKGPARICNLREDSLAQMLTYGNVRANSKVMICESISGLLLGAVLERLGGYGNIVQIYNGSHPSREALECFGFSTEMKKIMTSYPLNEVSTLHAALNKKTNTNESNRDQIGDNNISTPDTPAKSPDASDKAVSMDEGTAEEDKDDDGNKEDGSNDSESEQADTSSGAPAKKRKKQQISDEERLKRKIMRRSEHSRSQALLETRDMDVLLVATKQHPTPIVLGLMDFLAPSRHIVVHCMYKEPLLDCYVQLRNRGGMVNLQMSETWCRNYQVLPNRTHPTINMTGTGGYLLTGITVAR